MTWRPLSSGTCICIIAVDDFTLSEFHFLYVSIIILHHHYYHHYYYVLVAVTMKTIYWAALVRSEPPNLPPHTHIWKGRAVHIFSLSSLLEPAETERVKQ